MILRESDAHAKLCPFTMSAVRMDRDQYGSEYRIEGPFGCLGSPCMAWRRVQRTDAVGQEPVEFGYCGAFGRLEVGE